MVDDADDTRISSSSKRRHGAGRRERREKVAEEREANQLEEFMRELELDPEMRSRVNMYKAPVKVSPVATTRDETGIKHVGGSGDGNIVGTSVGTGAANSMSDNNARDGNDGGGGDDDDDDDDDDDEGFPEISLDELLDDLHVSASSALPGEAAGKTDSELLDGVNILDVQKD